MALQMIAIVVVAFLFVNENGGSVVEFGTSQ
jgi:hypothetical protein